MADFPSLAEAALAAVTQWRYRPATHDGKPVKVYFTVIIEFNSTSGQEGEHPEENAYEVLDGLAGANIPMALHFRATRLERVFEAIEGASGTTILGKENLPEVAVDVDWSSLTLREALERLGRQHHIRYELRDPKTVVLLQGGVAGAHAVSAR